MDYFTQKKYLEYKVLELKNGKPVKKELTEKGFAMISDKDADTLNGMVASRKLWYELEEVKPKKAEK